MCCVFITRQEPILNPWQNMSALLYKSYISLNLLCHICVLILQCRDFSCSILLRFLLRKPEQIRVEEPGVASRNPGDSRIRDDFITPKYGWVLTKQLLQNLHNHLNNKLKNIQLEQEQNRIEPICSYSNEVFYFLLLFKVGAWLNRIWPNLFMAKPGR